MLPGVKGQVPVEGQGQPEQRALPDRQGQHQGQGAGAPEGQLALVPVQGEQALVLPQGSPVTLAPERPPGLPAGWSMCRCARLPLLVDVNGTATPSRAKSVSKKPGGGNREQALVPGQGHQDFWSRPPPSVQSPDQGNKIKWRHLGSRSCRKLSRSSARS